MRSPKPAPPARAFGPIRSSGRTTRHTLKTTVGQLVIIAALSTCFALAVVWNTTLAVVSAACVAAVALARALPKQTEKVFLYSLLIVLAGYAMFGRTFAGIGVFPVFVGELVLVLGLLSTIGNGWPASLLRTPITGCCIIFMLWGAVQTVPYFGVYGLNAMRDSVIWGYGSFTLLFVPVILRRHLVWRLPEHYRRLLPWIVVIAPASVVFWMLSGLVGIPGTAMTGAKPADSAPHLAGAAAFLLTGLAARPAFSRRATSMAPRESAVWFALLPGIIVIGSLTRGGLVAIIAAMGIATVLKPSKAGRKLVQFGTAALVVGILWLVWPSEYVAIEKDRAMAPEQILQNLMSIGGGHDNGLEDTRQWRIVWWEKIIDYTVHGPYFWTGKGFGVNLSFDDGIEPDPDAPNRNPHNGSLTVLARAGVPGLVLWAALQAWFAFAMLRGWLRAKRSGQHDQASVFAWVLAYWMAILINATFDPSLEGPQGGIWFWCVIAYGVALSIEQLRPEGLVASRVPRQAYARVPVHPS